MSAANPVPRWRVTLDGRDLTGTIQPRLIDLTVSSCRGDDADQLDIRLSDHDGKLDIPRRGAKLNVWLGWDSTGLVDKGVFSVDEIAHEGAPDVLTLRGRSADFKSGLRTQHEQSWHATTVGTIIDALAGRNGLTPRCHASLRNKPIDHIDQTNESDINFLTRLGKRYDAVATIKARTLIFALIGQGTTASGQPIPSYTLTRDQGDRHHWQAADRGAFSGVRAHYDDKATGRIGTVMAGDDDGNGIKTLRTIYATESNAMRAARSEFQRLQRGAATFSYDLACGRPELYAEMPIKVHGFKAQIDATDWLIVRATHRLGEGGLVSSLELESKPDNVDNAPESDLSDDGQAE